GHAAASAVVSTRRHARRRVVSCPSGAMMTTEPTNRRPKDARVASAIAHWGPRFVANGVSLTDFEEVTASIAEWTDWCRAWSARAAVHEGMGREALVHGHYLSASEHLSRAAVCYHFAKFLFVHAPAEMRAAHAKAVECRRLAVPHLRPPGER